MKFPPCLSEAETIERAIAGANLARYGDGEFNLAKGGNCVSQKAHPKLAAELRGILEKAPKGCLPCLPDPNCGGGKSPKRENWLKVMSHGIPLGQQEYGSSFITRPDTAPWIDNAIYWGRVRDLWRGKDVTLVKGSERSLRLGMMADARSVREVWGAYEHAYDAREIKDPRTRADSCKTIDELMDAVGACSHAVLLCIGPTATAMAARLAKKGVHAVDVGHLGMFMRHAGAYRFKADDLISPEYRAMLKEVHKGEGGWGNSGYRHADDVAAFAADLDAESILDYGCGSRSLERRMAEISGRRVAGYDPAFHDVLPKPMDMVVCTDVLEHVEPNKIDNVLAHIRSITGKGAYFNIALGSAKQFLPDGRNLHLIVAKPNWWIAKVQAAGWKEARPSEVTGKSIRMWLYP